jgi:prepilin-type N-terminal cleavage/methylation domain-containing protein
VIGGKRIRDGVALGRSKRARSARTAPGSSPRRDDHGGRACRGSNGHHLPCRAGFSLVEVLVALAIVGLIVSAAAAATGVMRRVETRVEDEASAREAIVAAERVFRAVVAGAFPEPPGSPPVGGGTAERLTLASRGPAILTLDRPWPMTLAIVPEGRLAEFKGEAAAGGPAVFGGGDGDSGGDGAAPLGDAAAADDGFALVLIWRDPANGSVRREVVLAGARAMKLFYFDDGVRPAGLRTAASGDDPARAGGGAPAGAGWRSSWTQPAVLPRAVLLRVDLPALGAPVDLAVRTVPTLPDACLLLPHVAACARWRGR